MPSCITIKSCWTAEDVISAFEESGKKTSVENAEIWLIEHKAEFLNRMGALGYEVLKSMLKEENNHGA